MTVGKTALIAVDVQPDFIDGALGGQTENAVACRRMVIPGLLAIVPTVDFVVASCDWHPENHCSFADEPTFTDGSWPKHCVAGTAGATIVPEIAQKANVIVRKGMDARVEQYSAFEGTTLTGVKLADVLRKWGVSRVIVGGLCTDYCVLATALDAVKAGFDTTLELEASCGVANATTVRAVQDMAAAGVKIEPYRLRFVETLHGSGNVRDLHELRDRQLAEREAQFNARAAAVREAQKL